MCRRLRVAIIVIMRAAVAVVQGSPNECDHTAKKVSPGTDPNPQLGLGLDLPGLDQRRTRAGSDPDLARTQTGLGLRPDPD